MNKSILVTGSLGQERLDYIANYLNNFFTNIKEEITIYDSTYGFVKYSHFDNCKYFSVDNTLSFIDYLKTLKERNNKSKLNLVFEAYAGLFYTKSNLILIEDILNNKDLYNLDILVSSRHIDFIPDTLKNLFTDKISFKEEVTPISNGK